MAVLIKRSLKAFTIVETLAALLLVSISIGVTFLLLTAVIVPGRPDTVMKADILLTTISNRAKYEQIFENRTFSFEELRVKQEFVEKKKYLYLMQLTATDPKGNIVHTTREYIYRPSR